MAGVGQIMKALENQGQEFRLYSGVKNRKLQTLRGHKTEVDFKQVPCSESQGEWGFGWRVARKKPCLSHAKELLGLSHVPGKAF